MGTAATGRWPLALGVGLAVVALGVALAWLFQRSLVYFPDRRVPPPAAEVLDGARDVVIVTADGLRLGAWFSPPPDDGGPTVLLAHGNAGNRADRGPLVAGLVDLGFGVLAFDYRGYGGNPGHPSEAGLALDARAARDFLVGPAGIPAEHLVYVGESLGAAVVTELAAEHPPAALVLRSPFTSLAGAGRVLYGIPVGWFLRDRFPVAEQVEQVGVPTAVVSGERDTTVPPRLSREVAQAAREGGSAVVEVVVPGADHNDAALVHGPALLAAVAEAAALGGAAPSTR